MLKNRSILSSALCALCLLPISVDAAEYFLKPISATGSHTFPNSATILLDGTPQTVTLEVRLKDWSPVPDAGSCDQSHVACSVLANNCPSGETCVLTNGLLQVYQVRIIGAGFQSVLMPQALPPAQMVDINHPQWVFFGQNSQLSSADTSPMDGSYAWGALVANAAQAQAYGGVDKYAGTLKVDVPAGAAGTYTIHFDPNINETLLRDTLDIEIKPLILTPGVISIKCEDAGDCDDGNACTNDVCNLPAGTCANNPNFDPMTLCCNPDTGQTTIISDGNPCTSDMCDTDTGDVTHMNLMNGTACNSTANTECDQPDTCLNGVCLQNFRPNGFACGNQVPNTQCNGADTCDGAGTCQTNIAPLNAICGNQDDLVCTDPDRCDGLGNCDPKNAPNGSQCNDDLFCTIMGTTTCLSGVCQGGTINTCNDNLPCTTNFCDEVNDICVNDLIAGNCKIDDGGGFVCYADGQLNPDDSCQICDADMPGVWTTLPPGTECDDGNPCTGTGDPPGTGQDLCDLNSMCVGVLDPNCNDNCEDALAVTEGSTISNNANVSPMDSAEASCELLSNNDIWFVYTADCAGQLLLSTTGSSLAPSNDTVLSVYSACGGTELACDNDGGPGLLSALTMTTMANTDYYIRVAGFNQNVGTIQLNVQPVGDCVIDNVCYTDGQTNPNNSCLECQSEVSTTAWTPKFRGTACGSQSQSECDEPNACDGAGNCEDNHRPDFKPCTDDGNDCTDDYCLAGSCEHPNFIEGTACGDGTITECDLADTCDGLGGCQDNFVQLGAACGNPIETQCDNPDICDGNGACDPNYKPAGTMCDDAEICTGNDICDGNNGCVGTGIATAPTVLAIGSRRLRVTPNPSGSPGPVALRVTSPDFPCMVEYIQANGSLESTPVEMLINDWATITVKDEDIVPSSTGNRTQYDVTAVCGDTYESPAGSAVMGLWGDANSSGITNFADVLLTIQGFQGIFNVPLEVLDIEPCTPNGIINFADVLRVIFSFQGNQYSDYCPVPCE